MIALVAVAAAVAFAVLWSSERDTSPEDVATYLRERSGDVQDTATEAIDALMNYDPATVDEREEQLLAISTGEFQDQVKELLDGGLGDIVEAADITSTGEIVDGPDPSFLTATRAIASARVIQDVTSEETPEGRTVFYVMQLSLIEIEGKWKADGLRILAQQSTN